MIERLLREHREITAIAARLRDALRSTTPDPEQLTACRWELAKAMMQHLAYEDRHPYLPLEAHPDPDVAAVAQRFKAHVADAQKEYEAHTARWTGAAMAADRRGYCVASIRQLQVLADRIRREERELFPLIPRLAERPGAVPAPTRNWARAALDVHAALGTG
jgi:hypothetical protein